MLEYTDGYLTIKGVKIHYYRTGGDKPPFLLLHGATDNGLCWTTTAEALSEKYDVVMPDAQGHGLSERLTPGFTYENHLHQAAALIKELGLEKPVIMGHSMGAATAADVAVEYPSLPRAIMLEDPPWAQQGTPPPPDRNEQGESFEQFLIRLNKLPLEKIIEEGRKVYPSWSDEERLVWAKAKQQFDPSLFSTTVINPRTYDEFIPEIDCPALLIIAESGRLSKETAQSITKLWKSKHPFKWVQIKGAAHNIRRENFPAYCDALLGFLEELPD